MFRRIVFTGAVLAFLATGRLSAEPTFSPGFTDLALYSRAGNPGTWTAGIQSFDFDSGGTLYVFAENRYIIRDPGGSPEVLYDFGSAVWGSFIKLDAASPQNVWFGESMAHSIQSVVSTGGPSQTPTPRGSLNYNYEMAVNGGGQVFVSANTTFTWQNPGSGEVWYWTGTAWQQVADMGGSSGPIAFDAADSLFYGFSQYNSPDEDVVFFTNDQVQWAISQQIVLPSGGANWTVYGDDLNTNYGLAYEPGSGYIFSSSSLGTVTELTGFGEYGPYGCGDSPAVMRCYGGRAYVLGTDWSDYQSTIFRLKPHPTVPLAVLKDEGGDQNLYVYNALVRDEWAYCDAYASNPSPLARDLWAIPSGDSAVAMVALNVDGAGGKEIAVLKNESGDHNIYVYNSPSAGDWTYWDAAARNPSPLARDFWAIPLGDNVFAVAAADIDNPADGVEEILVFRRDGGNDVNLYAYNCPVPGDWTYWDAASRNPSPLARDFWYVPYGDDAVALAGVDTSGDGTKDRLAVIRNTGGDCNLYLWNVPVPGDWTYWDAAARNPSQSARDFWAIPYGDSVKSIAGLDVESGTAGDEIVVLKEPSGDSNIYFYSAVRDGDWVYWDAASRNPSPLARDLWVIPSGNGAVAVAGLE